MELKNSHIELLEKQFFGSLTKEESNKLSDLMKSSEFEKSAREYLHIFQGIEDDVHEDLRKKMKMWDAQSRNTRVLPLGWMKYAAVFILVGVVASVFYFNSRNLGDIADYYDVYPNVITVRGTSDESFLAQALRYYDAENYGKAVSELLLTDSLGVEGQFYLAQSYFALSDYDKAKSIFRRQSSEDIVFRESAKWYWALCELKLENEIARTLLQEIAKSEGAYAARSEELLRLIK